MRSADDPVIRVLKNDVPYLTISQVYNWIIYREYAGIEQRIPLFGGSTDDYLPNYIIAELHELIFGKMHHLQHVSPDKPLTISRSMDALLQLVTELEKGRVKATGRRNGTGNPTSLAPYLWSRLTFVTSKPRDPTRTRTYAAFKSTLNVPKGQYAPREDYWSDLLFARKGVLEAWPPHPSETLEGTSDYANQNRQSDSAAMGFEISRIHENGNA